VLKIGPDHEQAVVVEVGDNHMAFMIKRNATRRVKLFPVDAFEAELAKELALAVEELDTVVACVRN